MDGGDEDLSSSGPHPPATSAVPWSTIPYYYAGPVPLRRQPVAQVVAVIYRATADIEPRGKAPESAAR